ncbi:MAG: tail fiber domain-containing protein [Bacteroidales bacterium]|nr:tail fiber domain-containing protein [Bacteroidales bacterium]
MKVTNTFFKPIIFIFLLFTQIIGYSQVPHGFNYQAVIRDGNGTPIANKVIGLRISLQDAASKVLYAETQSPLTNTNGVISITIGSGTQISDSSFTSIPWKTGEILVKIEIDPAGGTTYVQMGSPTKLQAVPYAYYAENVKEITSQPNALNDDPIFEVKNKSGQVVFGVYQEGVRVYVADTQIKGAKGGFAVGGLSNQAKAGQQEYFRITPDSARIWVKEVPSIKGAKGGFAVGGLSNQAKTIRSRNLMLIATDSARIWVNDAVKGAKGGFAVGGLSNQAKGSSSRFLSLTPQNSFIGQDAGKSITTGLYNSFIGYQAGLSNTAGRSNIFIGYQSGYSNIGDVFGSYGHLNIFVGNQSGYSNTTGLGNIFLGEKSGYQNTEGSRDVFIGVQSGQANLTGLYNVFIGYQSGCFNTTGSRNVLLGNAAGFHNTTGQSNIMIGDGAGWNNANGSNNIFLGGNTGANNTTGNSNVFLGVESGYNNIGGYSNTFIGQSSGTSNTEGFSNIYIGAHSAERTATGTNNVILGSYAGSYYAIGNTNVMIGSNAGLYNKGNNNVFIGSNAGYLEAGSNKLYITNTSDSTPLIFGDFSKDSLAINGKLCVYGFSGGTTGWNSLSDATLKTNIATLSNSLESVLQLRGVKYEWKDKSTFDSRQHIGFIAQEVNEIVPEVVSQINGKFAIDYAPLTAILVEAIKEQQQQIEKQKSELDYLKAKILEIEAMLKK